MDKIIISEGLCRFCTARTNCFSYKNSKLSGRPIMHCAEFDNYRENALRAMHREVAGNKDSSNTNESLVKNEHAKGLCVNCNDAEICKFSCFGNDVIFCEEHNSNFQKPRDEMVSSLGLADGFNFQTKILFQERANGKFTTILF